MSFSKVSSFQETSPLAGPLTTFLPPLRSLLRFSMMCSGAWATTLPWVSNPLRPARPAICLKSRTERIDDLLAAELGELGEEDGADGDVDPDAQRVRAGDDPQQPLLGELLDQQPVLRQQPRVVDADAEGDEALALLAVGGVEAEAAHGVADLLALLAGGDLHAGERLGELGALALGEVDDVDRRLAGLDELLDGLVERGLPVLEVERDRALLGADQGHLEARALLDVLLDGGDVAEGGGHQEEPGVRQGDEGDLPGDAALGVRVVVELVHHHVGGVEPLPRRAGRGWRAPRRCSR